MDAERGGVAPSGPKRTRSSSPAPTTSNGEPTSSTPIARAGQREDRRANTAALPKKSGDGGRGGGRGKKRDLGRSAWSKTKTDKRERNTDEQAAKRQRIERGEAPLPVYATAFSADAIAAEERRPKRKVAVLIGYSGTGYKGMQLAHDQKTIEGDLFKAFVAAGAVSKVNADDPKKSSFVRCARTDKGVHAAGNVISLKMIIEDADIVARINDKLSPQIRVWGFERTNNSFNAYQLCDSRIYEYLIPSYAFLPPHPTSFLGRKVEEIAQEKAEQAALDERQKEVKGFWEKVDEEVIKPILNEYDPEMRAILEKALYLKGEQGQEDEDGRNTDEDAVADSNGHLEANTTNSETVSPPNPTAAEISPEDRPPRDLSYKDAPSREPSPLAVATRRLRDAYNAARRAYRISPERLSRVAATLALYEGTRNYHNYTVAKTFNDPSSKRVIKSFRCNPTPLLINSTEWLSLKVHGQSFMMHQIRKMVGMLALTVRCGADPMRTLSESYGPAGISIPKAPSLGLLLERPVFDSYNARAGGDLGREKLDFGKFEAEMLEFKKREIYERIYREEERDNTFANFFNHVDNFPAETFLWATSGGVQATKAKKDDGLTNGKEVNGARASGVDGRENAASVSGMVYGSDSEAEDDKNGAEG